MLPMEAHAARMLTANCCLLECFNHNRWLKLLCKHEREFEDICNNNINVETIAFCVALAAVSCLLIVVFKAQVSYVVCCYCGLTTEHLLFDKPNVPFSDYSGKCAATMGVLNVMYALSRPGRNIQCVIVVSMALGVILHVKN